jgi:uncharacterized protein (DUF362 family)
MNDHKVAIQFVDTKAYYDAAPYDPPARYPEYEGKSLDPRNHVYEGVRNLLYTLGLDRANFNTREWNPFGELIRPGMTVFIKANTVTHEHDEGKDIFSVIVHASVLRPILDYVCKALRNDGRIIVGDSQLYYCDFDKAMKASRIGGLLEWYAGTTRVPFECYDMRMNRAVRTWMYGRWGRAKVEQDPRGYRFIDLKDKSAFEGIDPKRLRIAIASYKNMRKHHGPGKHEYLFPRSFLESDAVISIPKLKTHRRTAVTIALKNFMGLPALKDSLPHFITGSVSEGGDQYIHPSLRKKIGTFVHDQIQTIPYTPVKFALAVIKAALWNSRRIVPFKDDVAEAMWYGNDTLWRTLQDLNKAALYADKEGRLCDTPQRSLFVVVDGIIAGEGNGPLAPDPVPAGVLLAGSSAVAVDAVGATVMGFEIDRIPLIRKILDGNGSLPLYSGTRKDIVVVDGPCEYPLAELAALHNLRFEPHPGWKGYVELEERP